MKKCIRCEQVKNPSEFYYQKTRNRYYGECKMCMNTRNIARTTKLKLKAIEYLGGKCSSCGYDKNYKALEFHHLDSTQKDFSISQVKNSNWNKIKEEVKKCTLLCANCHREKHHEEWLNSNSIDIDLFKNLIYNNKKTFRINVRKEHFCKCEAKVSGPSRQCKKCNAKKLEKIKWPEIADLKNMVDEASFSEVGRQLGVSDNAVRKRIKNHDLSS